MKLYGKCSTAKHTEIKMWFIKTFLCVVLHLSSFCDNPVVGMAIEYKECGTGEAIPTAVDLSPCTSIPCKFEKGINATITIDFTTEQEFFNVTAKVFGLIGPLPIPYQIPNPNGCQGCNLQCPLQAGTHKYINILPVLKIYPSIKVGVKWQLLDQDDKNIVCFVFPMEIL